MKKSIILGAILMLSLAGCSSEPTHDEAMYHTEGGNGYVELSAYTGKDDKRYNKIVETTVSLYNENDEVILENLATQDGVCSIDGLADGTYHYIFGEAGIIEGYEEDTMHAFTVEKGHRNLSENAIITPSAYGEILLQAKTDAGQPLKQTALKVYYLQGEDFIEISEVTTNDKGLVGLNNLTYGTWKVSLDETTELTFDITPDHLEDALTLIQKA